MHDAGTRRLMELGRLPPRYQAALVLISTFTASIFVLVCGGLALGAGNYSNAAFCAGVLLWPMIAIGLFLMLIFCCGCCGVLNKDDCFSGVYLMCLSMAILALLVFVIFGYITDGGIDNGRNKVHDREYKLTEYRGWLRGRVANPQYWSKISACLHDKHACDFMRQLVRDPETGTFVPQRSRAKLKIYQEGDGPMPIESGCCKPPSSCGFTYVNETTWIPTPGAPAVETNVDCSRWSNEQQTLCFQCDSCRAGFLHESRRGWSIGAIFPIAALLFLCFSCPVQVYAFGRTFEE